MDGIFKGKFEDKEFTIKLFKDHEDEIIRTVPAEKLLIFETGKDGWEKLCSFLGKKNPMTPWPHLNTTEDFAKIFAAVSSGQATDLKTQK